MNLITEIIVEGKIEAAVSCKLVSILKQNWDFFYEKGYDDGEPDLDKNGYAYYVLYGEYDNLLSANRSQTCVSIEEAMKLAEHTLNIKIEWKRISPQCD